MNRASRRLSIVGYLLAILILVLDSVLISASLRTIVQSNGMVDESRLAIGQVEQVLSLLKDAETGQRGYLLTNDDRFLKPHLDAEPRLDPALERLRSLVSGRKSQGDRVEELATLAREKLAELKSTLLLRREGKTTEALGVVMTGRGRDLMDRVRVVASEVRLEEDSNLASRTEASRDAVRRTIGVASTTTGLAALLLVAVATIRRREVRLEAESSRAICASEQWLSTTLRSLGDAVIATDDRGVVTFLNPVAEALTGWSGGQAVGRPMAEIFAIVNETTRAVAENPIDKVLREGHVVGLADRTILIARDGTETPIDDSASPIRDEAGRAIGAVLVFRDNSERKERERLDDEQRRLAEFGRDVGLALTESLDLESLTRRCVEETVRHLDGAFSRLWTLNDESDVLELRASAGCYSHIEGDHARIPVGMYKIGKIAAERKPHLTNAVIGDPLVPAQDWAKREGMVAFAGYPLVVEDRLVGVWAMFARHPLSEATLRSMESVASGISLGIERMRGEERLRREQEWLKVTLASIGDAVIATDTYGRITLLNPVAQQLTGWSVAEAEGRPIEEVFRIVNEQTGEPSEIPVERVIREGKVVGLANHTVLIARGGSETPIEDSAAPIVDPDRGIVGVVMVFRDASAERRHRSELLVSESRFRQLAETIQQLVWIADADGFIFWYNNRWYDYTGTTPEDMEGWGWQSVHDPAVLPSVMERWTGSIASGEKFDMVFPLKGADGVFRPFLTRIVPVKDERGRVIRWFGTNTDISEERRAEEALRLAKEEAESANRAKTQFLAILSHELRTPLNPILLAVSSMLERSVPPEDLRPNLEMIRQNVNLQSRLIDDLLDVMRIVRGKMPLHWEVVDSHFLIKNAAQICQSEVYGKKLELRIGLEAEHHHINADPVRLQQVLWNLIKNAVKFTPDGGSIAIRTRNEAEPGSPDERLVIEVIDTGIGIEPGVLGLIFDPFQQGETSITRKFGGLGLGLAISKGIVDGHGGSLTVESAGKGHGTSFRIALQTLPEAEANAQDQGQAPSTTKAEDRPGGRALKILLVEDEQATRQLMARLLKRLGHEVEAAGTIAYALEIEQAGGFELIVSDIGLPDGTGLELMKQIVKRRGPVPAIALTGYGMEEDIQRSREAGFSAHMTKPIDFTKLESMIRQVAS